MQQGQRGAVVIMEAIFVFPVVFFAIYFMLMAGEACYQYTRVEKACIQAAIAGAARCENPMLEAVQKQGEVPTGTSGVKIRPYRYIFTSEAANIANEVSGELYAAIEKFRPLAFRGMNPTNVQVSIRPKMNVLVSSFPVECSFDITLPIRMVFSGETLRYHYSVSVTEPIGDPAEFVRNVSTVQDYLERVEWGDKISDFVEKLKGALDKLARFMN